MSLTSKPQGPSGMTRTAPTRSARRGWTWLLWSTWLALAIAALAPQGEETGDQRAQAGSRSNGKSCSNNNQCRSGRCDMAPGNPHRCIPNDGTGSKGTYCTHNNQCKPGKSCVAHECGGKTRGVGEKCYGNGDCAGGRRCDGKTHKCIPNDGTGKTGQYCTHNNHCKNKNCVGHQCKAAAGIGKSCQTNAGCAGGRRCDGKTHKCIPDDGTGKKNDYCTHNNHCVAGKYYCISHRCSTPLKNGEKCNNHGECKSGCCSGRKCSVRNQCYKPEDAFCDIFTGGGCSIIRNSVAELQTLASDARQLEKEIRGILKQLGALTKSTTKQLDKFGKAVISEAKKSAKATLKKGKATLRASKDLLADNVKESTKIVVDFTKKAGGVCSAGPGMLAHKDALAKLKKAKARVVAIDAALRKLSVQPLTVAKDLVNSKIKHTLNQHKKLALGTLKSTIRMQKDLAIRSLNVALAPIQAFIKDPIGTATNPLGTLKSQIRKALQETSAHLATVDKEFNKQADLMREAVVAEVRSNTQDVLSLMDGVRKQQQLAAALVKQMHGLAKTCAATDGNALVKTTKRKVKKTPSKLPVPKAMRLAKSVKKSPAWKHRTKSSAIVKTAKGRAKKVSQRIAKVDKKRKGAQGKSKKQKAKIKKRFDELFKGKSKAQARKNKKAFLAEMKALYGKSPAVMKQIKKQLAAEMKKRGH